MRSPFHKLYFWVLGAIILGISLGISAPDFALKLRPLADGFIRLIKIFIAPLIFTTIAAGIGQSGGGKQASRVALKALIYFEVVSTFALVLGLGVANFFHPGASFHVRASDLDPMAVTAPMRPTTPLGVWFGAFVGEGNLIYVLVTAVGVGGVLHLLRERPRKRIVRALNRASTAVFSALGVVMLLAPIGAGASMAFTVAKFRVAALRPMIFLMGCFYLTCLLFVFGVLGGIARALGFPITRFLRYISEELWLVLGTSSSESALASLMLKLERLGCPKSIVGLVVPAGYSLNLDGTNIYLTLACLFVAQALGIHLGWGQQLSILFVAMVSSKGASGVTGAGFITLAATLSAVPEVPVAGLALILGVDRFMPEGRSITNLIGNGIACLAITRSEGRLDRERLQRELEL